MGRIYNIIIPRTAVTAAVDLVEILTPAAVSAWIHRIKLSQSTEVGDAQEEMLQLAFKWGQTTSGSGGSAATPAKVLPGDAASVLTCEVLNTTKATAGTIVTSWISDWNERVVFDEVFTPETRLFIGPSTRATIELVSAPADGVTICGTITVEEIG